MAKTGNFPSSGTMKHTKTQSSEDLLRLAENVGLGEQANKILEAKGEEVEEIFSGGFISDIFDGLNALQYGTVGLMKGKGFMEGIKTRQSWAQKDALGGSGMPGVIAGIALDIISDPFTYIAPWTIFKKIPGAMKLTGAIGKGIKSTRLGQMIGKKLVYRFGQSKVYKELADRTIKGIGGAQYVVGELGQALSKITPEVASNLFVRNADATLSLVAKADLHKYLGGDELKAADELWDMISEYGVRANDAGLIDNPIENYVANMYKSYETKDPSVLAKLFGKKKRIQGDRFKKRILKAPTELEIDEAIKMGKKGEAQKLIEERASIIAKRADLGEMKDSVYPMVGGLMQTIQDVHNAEMFSAIAKNLPDFAGDAAKAGFKTLPETKKLGALSGKAVPEFIFDDFMDMTRPIESSLFKKGMAGFKFGKVVMNPATHARNIMSNFMLNNMEGLRPWRLDYYKNAMTQVLKKGADYQEFKKAGGAMDSMMSTEIGDILLGPDGMKAATGMLGKTGRGGKKAWKKMVKKLGDLYQGEEEVAKMAQFMYQRDKLIKAGMKEADAITEAVKIAERATFNYAQVTPFIRKVRESAFGLPFVTFSYKATPQVVKTLGKNPGRLSWIGKMKNAIEKQAGIEKTNRERRSEPQWMKDGFYVKMPMKDKHGRSAYLDLTYIIPFGDLVSGQILERQIDRDTGLPESTAEGLVKKSPVINLISEISKNQDFYGNKIWKASDSSEKQGMDLFRHIAKSYLPPAAGDMIPGGHIAKGRKAGQRRKALVGRLGEAGEGQYRTLTQEALRNVGLKIQPMDIEIQETYSEWEKKKALETLLNETGNLREYTRTYRPK